MQWRSYRPHRPGVRGDPKSPRPKQHTCFHVSQNKNFREKENAMNGYSERKDSHLVQELHQITYNYSPNDKFVKKYDKNNMKH